MRAILLVIIFALALAACAPTGSEPPAMMPTPTVTLELVCIRVIFEIMVSGDADVLAETEAAFLGEVTAISPTHFNQDSGQYYPDAMGIHTVTFRVIEPIVDEIGLGPEVTLTSLAGSPVDNGHVDIVGGNVACYDIQVSHEFAVGQQMVVMARRGGIVWREGDLCVRFAFNFVMSLRARRRVPHVAKGHRNRKLVTPCICPLSLFLNDLIRYSRDYQVTTKEYSYGSLRRHANYLVGKPARGHRGGQGRG